MLVGAAPSSIQHTHPNAQKRRHGCSAASNGPACPLCLETEAQGCCDAQGSATFLLEEYEAAEAAYEKGLELEPTNAELKVLLR